MGNHQSEEQPAQDEDADSTPRLYQLAKLGPEQLPILYSPDYNISFWGLQNMHPFDSGKWGKVYNHLIDGGMIKDASSIVTPHEVNESELLVVHTDTYLKSLTSSSNVAMVVEVPPVAILPNSIVQNRLLRPFRVATGGTIMAGKLAMERGWAINIGGGFHHCSSSEGGGFCAYADITLSIKFMFNHMEAVSKVMIVDLDAHQGNGHERDFIDDDKVYILDMYNKWIYPNDREAKAGISTPIELDVHTRDDEYLDHLRRSFPKSLDTFEPDIVVYNAGTDVLIGDSLGRLDITPKGVVTRDQIVFEEAMKRKIPIFMVTSGGYQRNNARVIADSILNLNEKKLISNPRDDPHVTSELRTQGAPLESDVDFCPPMEQSEDSVGIDGSREESVEPNLDTAMDHPPQETTAVSSKEEATNEATVDPSEKDAKNEATVDHSEGEATNEATVDPSEGNPDAINEATVDHSEREATHEATVDPSKEEATKEAKEESEIVQENETVLPQKTEPIEHAT